MDNTIKILFFAALLMLLSLGKAHAEANVSVVFVLDESGSVGSSDFQLETQGFMNALDTLPTNGNTEVSVVGFASSSQILASNVLLTPSGADSLRLALSSNSQSGGGTGMASAIDTASQVLANSSALTKVICIATDGQPNNQSNTLASVSNAKSSGIVIAPIGVGLDSTGKTFLDSIATNPPVPNPASFDEFGTVVQNICIGVVESALNIELTPDSIDFGASNGNSTECSQTESIGLLNHSDNIANITNISLEGEDADQFKIVNALGLASGSYSLPAILPSLYSTTIEVEIAPNQPPIDSSYDASLVVTASDENGVTSDFTATLKSPLDTSCLSVNILDASPTITSISSASVPISSSGNPVEESDVELALGNDKLKRSGLVSDGNSRLLLSAKTTLTQGTVRFEIVDSDNTSAVLHSLGSSPMNSGGSTVDIPITLNSSGDGQATAILRAGERFLGGRNQPESVFKVKTCVLDNLGVCSSITKSNDLSERRAPVVLVHGLWAGPESFVEASGLFTIDKPGLKESLESNALREVRTVQYNNWQGPTATMTPTSRLLTNSINQACTAVIQKHRLACTKADLVGHSMGGLVSRKYIQDNETYKNDKNYQHGSVRRLLTLGTPHFGSGLASLLKGEDANIGECLRDERLLVKDKGPTDPLVDENGDVFADIIRVLGENEEPTLAERILGYEVLANGQTFVNFAGDRLTGFGKNVDISDSGAINYLALNSAGLNALNANTQNVPSAGLIGNIGDQLLFTGLGGGAVAKYIQYTGCVSSDMFQQQDSDGVVSISSALGRLGTANTETLMNVQHTGMGQNQLVIDWVIEMLDDELSNFSPSASIDRGNATQFAGSSTHKLKEGHTGDFTMVGKIRGFITGVIFSFAGISNAYADDIAVSLTVDNAAPSAGQSITFKAEASSGSILVATLEGEGITLDDESAPFEWTTTIPEKASGEYSFYALALIGTELIKSNTVDVKVMPNLSSLKSLAFDPGDTLVLYPGGQEQLKLNGLFSDGLKRNLTSASVTTTYSKNSIDGQTVQTGSSSMFDVTVDGLITAKQPGEAEVVVSNSGFTTSRRILVVAASETDADGDGLSDVKETEFGTDLYNPDSDNDGTPDNIEYDEAQQVQPEAEQPQEVSSGSSGGGCAINTSAGFDPSFILMILISFGYLLRRRKLK